MPTVKVSTDTQIKKAIKQHDKDGKTTYCNVVGFSGLRLRLRGGSNEWQHRYTHPYTGKRPEMTLGHYPAVSLENARQQHRDNSQLLAQRIDPIAHREKQRQLKQRALKSTFAVIAHDWMTEKTSNPAHQPAKRTLENINSYLTPLLDKFGNYPISEITSQQVLALCADVQKTYSSKAKNIQSTANNIFGYAVMKGLLDINPMAQLAGVSALQPHKTKHYPAITDPKEFAVLLRDIDAIQNTRNYNKPVLQLLALTFVRKGDICAMRWQDIDWQAKQWIFTPQKGDGRSDMVDSLIVPLSTQAFEILAQMHTLTGAHEFVFYNARRKQAAHIDSKALNKQLCDPSMNGAGIGQHYDGNGYKGVHTPHGFRASAKTLLMERLECDELITELQLGHNMLNKYGKAYNRMHAIKKRTHMMQRWADYLDALRAGKIDNVIHADFNQSKEKNG